MTVSAVAHEVYVDRRVKGKLAQIGSKSTRKMSSSSNSIAYGHFLLLF